MTTNLFVIVNVKQL